MNPMGASLPGRLYGVAGDINHPVAGFWPGIRHPAVPRAGPLYSQEHRANTVI